MKPVSLFLVCLVNTSSVGVNPTYTVRAGSVYEVDNDRVSIVR